jgi:hypothetical protein
MPILYIFEIGSNEVNPSAVNTESNRRAVAGCRPTSRVKLDRRAPLSLRCATALSSAMARCTLCTPLRAVGFFIYAIRLKQIGKSSYKSNLFTTNNSILCQQKKYHHLLIFYHIMIKYIGMWTLSIVCNRRVGSRQIRSWHLQFIDHRPPGTGINGSDHAARARRPAD